MPFGLHRVLNPMGSLPQAAARLDAQGPLFDNEIEIAVSTLNIDSASFHQIIGELGEDEKAVSERILSIVAERGKMQNPVTGSGGMLIGTVMKKGHHYIGDLEVGDRVASLVSLTLTPLKIDDITKIHFNADQVDVHATAYLWTGAPIVRLPDDLSEKLALSALDVCGAPAQADRLCKGKQRVLILGAGKSGALCAAAAREAMGSFGSIYGFDLHPTNLDKLKEAKIIDDFRTGDATNPVHVFDSIMEMTGGELMDVVINTCNVSNTEMSAILPCADRGTTYFFNMATSFGKAALGCEGVGKDINLLIGNGFAHGHAEMTLKLVRSHEVVRNIFETI